MYILPICKQEELNMSERCKICGGVRLKDKKWYHFAFSMCNGHNKTMNQLESRLFLNKDDLLIIHDINTNKTYNISISQFKKELKNI